MKRLLAWVMLAAWVALAPAWARAQDDQYVRIYNLIQEADGLNNNSQTRQALAKYLEAQTALQRFQKSYAQWNPRVVNFRLNYLSSKIATLSAKVPAPVPTPASTPSGVAPKAATVPAAATPPSVQNQLGTLQDQVRQLTADKSLLEAKLREALAAQPASMDPRELAKANERIRTLQKENDLLKITAAQQKAAAPLSAGDTRTLELTRQELAAANRKLQEQTDLANTLALEKKALQNKLNTVPASRWNEGTLETTRKALEDANRRLTQQEQQSAQLTLEKDALQARLKSLSADAESAAALRAENQLLKKQLAELRAPATSPGKADEVNRRLAQAQAQIAALQSDKELLRLEKIALESRLRQISSPTVASTVMPAPSQSTDAARIKQLERERDDLQKRLDASLRQQYGRKGKAVASRIDEMETQLASLRARLEVFETRQVPYTAEELALFKAPQQTLAAADPRAGKKSVKELPAGSVALVAEAQRYFASRQLDKAEANYQQVLRRDDKNVVTLANLAAIQLEENHLDDAEKNIQKALTLAPEDAYSLTVLGQLRFRQGKYDPALDALSRAAKIEPQNAQIQNLLGLTLGQKGLRGPAETALRKAITLEPGNGDAHNNLAVIYLTQQPPLVELARWHYQKALAAGHARNLELEQMLEARKPIE